jgi:hypothetical protein
MVETEKSGLQGKISPSADESGEFKNSAKLSGLNTRYYQLKTSPAG